MSAPDEFSTEVIERVINGVTLKLSLGQMEAHKLDQIAAVVAPAVADELERRAALRRDAGHRAHCPHWADGGRCCCCGDPALPAPDLSGKLPRFGPAAALVVDTPAGLEQWTGQRWNEYMELSERARSPVMVRLVDIVDPGEGGAARG